MSGLQSSTGAFEQSVKPPRGLNSSNNLSSEYITQQWLLRKQADEQENVWIPSLKHNGPFSHRNAMFSGEPVTKESFPFRSALSESHVRPGVVPDRIVATTRTTQTLAQNNEFIEPGRPVRRSSGVSITTISAAHSSVRSTDEAFNLEMLRDEDGNVWEGMTASPSLDIIEDYEDEELDDILGSPRKPPVTLPPIPALPPPSARSVSFSPRGPYGKDEFDIRGLQRHVSNDSTTSNDPLDPNAFYALSPSSIKSSSPQLRNFSLVPPPNRSRRASHHKTQSQSRLLPLHLNQAPCLTTDKPILDEQTSSRAPDSVTMHWILLFVFFICPPMWLVLASGSLDELLHVPIYPISGRMDSLAATQRREYLKIRRVKQVAGVLGSIFWAICGACMIVGLVLA